MTEQEFEHESLQAVYKLDRELGRLLVSESEYSAKVKSYMTRVIVAGGYVKKVRSQQNNNAFDNDY